MKTKKEAVEAGLKAVISRKANKDMANMRGIGWGWEEESPGKVKKNPKPQQRKELPKMLIETSAWIAFYKNSSPDVAQFLQDWLNADRPVLLRLLLCRRCCRIHFNKSANYDENCRWFFCASSAPFMRMPQLVSQPFVSASENILCLTRQSMHLSDFHFIRKAFPEFLPT